MSNSFLLEFDSLGLAWLKLIQLSKEKGIQIDDEIFEIQNVQVSIQNVSKDDFLLQGDQEKNHINEMYKVFFEEGNNNFGHSYKNFIHGPKCKTDYTDIIELLKNNLLSKKAAIVLVGDGKKVPCLLTVHFLVRNNTLLTKYFARGQDIYNKYYADSLAVYEMSKKICTSLNLKCGAQTGFISSAHIYKSDLDNIGHLLNMHGLI